MGSDEGVSTLKAILQAQLENNRIHSALLFESRRNNELLEKLILPSSPPKTKANRDKAALIAEIKRFILISTRDDVTPTFRDISRNFPVSVSTLSKSKHWKAVRDYMDDLSGKSRSQTPRRGHKTADGDIESYDD